MRRALRAWVFGTFLVATPTQADAEEESTKRACIEAHADTQRLRREEKLQSARERSIACAAEACPDLVRIECARFLDEIEAAIPRLILDVRTSDGQPTLDAALFIDEKPVLDRLSGAAIALDPGEHRLVVAPAVGPKKEVTVVLHEGEARRSVLVQLDPAAPRHADETVPPEPRAQSASKAAEEGLRTSVSWLPYGLSGLAALGLGTFVIFGLQGMRDESALAASCAPACDPARVSDMRREYLIADVGLGIGIVSAAAAVWLFLRQPAHPR